MIYLILLATSWDGYFHFNLATEFPEAWHFKFLDHDPTDTLEKAGSFYSKTSARATSADVTFFNMLVFQNSVYTLSLSRVFIYLCNYSLTHSFIPQWRMESIKLFVEMPKLRTVFLIEKGTKSYKKLRIEKLKAWRRQGTAHHLDMDQQENESNYPISKQVRNICFWGLLTLPPMRNPTLGSSGPGSSVTSQLSPPLTRVIGVFLMKVLNCPNNIQNEVQWNCSQRGLHLKASLIGKKVSRKAILKLIYSRVFCFRKEEWRERKGKEEKRKVRNIIS